MTIKEAKKQASGSTDEVVKTLLEYIDYLENNYAKVKQANEAHRGLTGKLYKQIDER